MVGTFQTAIQSFRSLSQSEAAAIHPNRIDFYTVRQGDTWATIAERQGRGVADASTLAIMNDHDPGDAPTPGTRVKIVVPG